MKTTEIIAGTTVEIEIRESGTFNASITQKFKSLKECVADMKNRDVIYKAYRIGDKLYSLKIRHTMEAVENWEENAMRINSHDIPMPELPTAMWE